MRVVGSTEAAGAEVLPPWPAAAPGQRPPQASCRGRPSPGAPCSQRPSSGVAGFVLPGLGPRRACSLEHPLWNFLLGWGSCSLLSLKFCIGVHLAAPVP